MTETTDVVARLRAMHKPRTERPGSCCVQCGIVWPCPTSRVLDEAAPAAVPSAPADRAAILNEAIDRVFKYGESLSSTGDVRIAHGMAAELQRMADEAQQPTVRPSCPDPIECGYEAALGQAEMKLEQVHATATAWARESMTEPTRIAGLHLLRILDGDETQQPEAEPCGAWGGCTLARGHNIGQADIPENHRPPTDGSQQPETQADDKPAVCAGFQWIGQSFATCERCGQPAWDHDGEEVVAVDGAGPFDTRRTVRPWKPGEADAIRAKWAPATADEEPTP